MSESTGKGCDAGTRLEGAGGGGAERGLVLGLLAGAGAKTDGCGERRMRVDVDSFFC